MYKRRGACLKTEKKKHHEAPNLTLTLENKAGRNKGMEMHTAGGKEKLNCHSDNTWLLLHPTHFDEKVTLTSTIKNQRNRQIPGVTFCLILIYDDCKIKAKKKGKKTADP